MKMIIYGICAVLGALWASQIAEAGTGQTADTGPGRCEEDPHAATTTSSQTDSVRMEEWLQAALKGNPEACKRLGQAYADDSEQLVERNLRASLNWYLKAARLGDAEAQRLAGEGWLLLCDELEAPRPYEVANARHWLEQSAVRGDLKAQALLKTLPKPTVSSEAVTEASPATAISVPANATAEEIQREVPAPAGRTEAWPARPDDYARLLSAFDTAAAHGTRLMTPQDPKLGVVVSRSRFEALRDRILAGDDYGAATYRAALDSLQAHHTIRTFEDMGLNYMLFKVRHYYDTHPIDWGAGRETAPGRYTVTDLRNQSDYVVEQSSDGVWRVRREPIGGIE